MKGKNRCKILKDIRRRIAEENGIEYITTECKYKGDCSGTCPKCESEVRYLESQLEQRRKMGYKITLAGIAAGIAISSTGCTPDFFSKFNSTQGDMEIGSVEEHISEYSLQGDVVTESSLIEESETDGELPEELMGEPAEYFPDDSSKEELIEGELLPEIDISEETTK